MKQTIRVAFVCVHNSCRSQIAEALGKALAADTFESYSAGTETKPRINQDAVRLMKQLHGIDMEETQRSKLLAELPPVDIVVTMGCNVSCPTLPCRHREDWGSKIPPASRAKCLKQPSGPLKKEFWSFAVVFRIVPSSVSFPDFLSCPYSGQLSFSLHLPISPFMV